MSQIGKFMLALLLLAGGAIGLALTLCGAAFITSGADTLILALPALAAGIALMYAVVKGLNKLFDNTPASEDLQADFADTQAKDEAKPGFSDTQVHEDEKPEFGDTLIKEDEKPDFVDTQANGHAADEVKTEPPSKSTP